MQIEDVEHELDREDDERVPDDEIPDRVEEVRPEQRLRLPGVREGLTEIDSLGAERADVFFPDDRPSADAELVVLVSAREGKGSLARVALVELEPADPARVRVESARRQPVVLPCLHPHGRGHPVRAQLCRVAREHAVVGAEEKQQSPDLRERVRGRDQMGEPEELGHD
eukprot:Amastigsp_a176233_196.p2 type:complete len:169 gc:universal Amastigsp_a176233_196:107-613(+)